MSIMVREYDPGTRLRALPVDSKMHDPSNNTPPPHTIGFNLIDSGQRVLEMGMFVCLCEDNNITISSWK